MADSYLIKLLSEDGSIYRPILVGYWKPATTPSANTYYGGTYRDEHITYVSIGSVLNGLLFSVPATDDATTTFEVIWNIIESNYQIKFRITHAQGNNTYAVKVFFYNASGSELSESPDFTLYTSDSGYISQFSLLLYPNTFNGDVSAITHFGFCRIAIYRPTLDIADECIYKMYGHSSLPFDTIFGGVSIAPSYPRGGLDPEDNWGGDFNNFDTDSDDIEMPSVVASAINNGYIQTYVITASQMANLMSEVLDFTNTTVTDFWSNISKVYGDPISAIISLKQFCVPTEDIPTWGATNVKLLNFTSEVYCPVVNVQYAVIDIGSITVDEFFGGFLDYPPYTRCTIYLPFIGEKELNVQEIMDSTLHLYYMVDYLTGNCVAHLIVTKRAGETNLNSDLYQWQGNLATDIPISGNNDANTLGNMLTSALSGLTAGMSLSIGGVISGLENEIRSASGTKVLAGSIGSGYSLMGVRTPYIKIENPIQSMPENFTELKGMRDGIQHTLNELSGYASVLAVNIDNVTATDDEKALIKSLLMEGIII